jgi:hypothetical protein
MEKVFRMVSEAMRELSEGDQKLLVWRMNPEGGTLFTARGSRSCGERRCMSVG